MTKLPEPTLSVRFLPAKNDHEPRYAVIIYDASAPPKRKVIRHYKRSYKLR